jgi:hypothetical protein
MTDDQINLAAHHLACLITSREDPFASDVEDIAQVLLRVRNETQQRAARGTIDELVGRATAV